MSKYKCLNVFDLTRLFKRKEYLIMSVFIEMSDPSLSLIACFMNKSTHSFSIILYAFSIAWLY